MLRYPIPAARSRLEQSIEHSRFICTLAPASSAAEAQRVIRSVTEEMPDANHHCWAFVAGPPGRSAETGASDDGEPRGTAGRPMLVVLRHSGIGDVVAVVTRYFGGVKLGTGGLARAYGGCVQAALGAMPRAEHVATTPFSLVATYPQVDAILKVLARDGVAVTSQRFEADVRLELLVPSDRVTGLGEAIRDITRGLVQLRPENEPGDSAHPASHSAAPNAGAAKDVGTDD